MQGPITVTVTTSAGGTSWAWGTAGRSENVAQLDYQKTGGVTIESVVTTSGAGLTYNIEYSNDPITAVTSITGSSQMTWFSSGSSAEALAWYYKKHGEDGFKTMLAEI